MRVMIDTNILVSALLFPSQQMNALMYKIMMEYQLVLSSYVIDELLDITSFAVTAASLSTQTPGGMPSVPDEDDVLKMM